MGKGFALCRRTFIFGEVRMRCCRCNTYIGRVRMNCSSRRDSLEHEVEEGEDYGGKIGNNHYCHDCYEYALENEDEVEE